MTLRERLEWVGRVALLVFILASAAFLSAITAMRIAIHGRETTMPNLVGTNVAQASAILRSRGLVLKVADHIYSDLPINSIVRQTPTAGLLMKQSQQAHVVVSLGQRQLEIPLLEGHSLRASRIELLRNGLQIGEVSAATLEYVTPDDVVLQNPRPGAGAATPRVDVLVAQAPREPSYVMPNLIGLDEVAAQRRLDAAELHRKINYVAAPPSHAVVIDQTPPPGTRTPASTEVELTIAK
jgi:eukaryotic-like serine/threonine-protein kinase